MVKIYYSKTKQEAGKKAAQSILNILNVKKDAVLGLATGSSPLDMYSELVNMFKNELVSFKYVRAVNLDEYVGLSPENDQSYAYFMRKNLFDEIDIEAENTHIPNGLAEDYDAECKRYDNLIASLGGTDVQVLGIGVNGHIGFNEPSDAFSDGTALVYLTDSTIKANSRFFDDVSQVPTMAFSMGIGQIMSSKKIILLANGEAKAEILEAALFGKITPEVPASILQTAADVEVFADEQALSKIISLHNECVIR